MPLPDKISKLEEVAEDFRSLYTKDETTGEHSLQPPTALKKALDSERASVKQLKDQIKKFDGIDITPEQLKELREQQVKSDEERKKLREEEARQSKQKFDEWKAEVEEEHKRTLTEKEGRIQSLGNEVHRLIVEGTATQVIKEMGGEPDLLLPAITKRIKLVEMKSDGGPKFDIQILDENGNRAFSKADDKEYMDVNELVGNFKSHQVYSRAFSDEVKQGFGSRSSSSKGDSKLDLSKLSPTEKLKAGRRMADNV